MISPHLQTEIDAKLSKIRGNPDAYDARLALVNDSLKKLGDVHSFWIENPGLRMALLGSTHVDETSLRKKALHGIRAVKNAWDYLTHIGCDRNFVNILDARIVKGTNALVQEGAAKTGNYRAATEFSTGDVTLNISGYSPPSARDVPQIVDRIIATVKEEYFARPIAGAIRFHLDLALTQPFEDGNKRTARLIQDRMLMDMGIPPAVIPAGEARHYLDLLAQATRTDSNGHRSDQGPFYNYMGSKINNGLDFILRDLEMPTDLSDPYPIY